MLTKYCLSAGGNGGGNVTVNIPSGDVLANFSGAMGRSSPTAKILICTSPSPTAVPKRLAVNRPPTFTALLESTDQLTPDTLYGGQNNKLTAITTATTVPTVTRSLRVNE